MQTLTRRGVGDVGAGLGLYFLHMSEGPFLHDAGQIVMTQSRELNVTIKNTGHHVSDIKFVYCFPSQDNWYGDKQKSV